MIGLQLKGEVASSISSIESKKGIYAIIPRSQDYNLVNQEVIRSLSKAKGRRGVYVTLLRSHCDMKSRLRESKISAKNIFFIDNVEEDKGCKARDCFFIGGNKSLTALSLALSEVYKKRSFDFVMIDSLNALLIYEQLEIVERFIHFLVSKAKNQGTLMVLMYSEDHDSKGIGTILEQFCDGCIRF